MRNQLFLLLCVLFSTGINAQDETAYSEAYEVFDFFVGHTNAGVFNGVEYYEKYPARNNKHKFFNSPNFQLGSLLYAQEPYYNLALKYDVYDDVLLARNPAVGSAPITLLTTEKINSFSIGDFTFLKLNQLTDKGEELIGFFEVLFDNNEVILMKKHRKKMIRKVENGVYYEFKDDPWYVAAYNGSYFKLRNENSLSTVFPKAKDYIKAYTKSNEGLKDLNYDAYLVSLFKGLNN